MKRFRQTDTAGARNELVKQRKVAIISARRCLNYSRPAKEAFVRTKKHRSVWINKCHLCNLQSDGSFSAETIMV